MNMHQQGHVPPQFLRIQTCFFVRCILDRNLGEWLIIFINKGYGCQMRNDRKTEGKRLSYICRGMIYKSNMNIEYGSILSTDENYQSVRSASRYIVFIRTAWFHKNTRQIKSQIRASTGVIVGSGCLLTAAHTIYQAQLQEFCDEIELVFNFSASSYISKESLRVTFSLNIDNFRCTLVRKDNKRVFEHDYALIKIPTDNHIIKAKLQDIIGQVYLLSNLQFEKETTKNFIIGFPDLTKEEAANFKKKKQQQDDKFAEAYIREDVGVIRRVEGDIIQYHCKTLSGQSGSPILVRRKKGEAEELCIVGVHSSYSKSKATGRGVFINTQTAGILNNWHKSLTQRKLYIKDQQYFSQPYDIDYFSQLPEFLRPLPQPADEWGQKVEGYFRIEMQVLVNELKAQFKEYFQQDESFGTFLDMVRNIFTQFKKILFSQLRSLVKMGKEQQFVSNIAESTVPMEKKLSSEQAPLLQDAELHEFILDPKPIFAQDLIFQEVYEDISRNISQTEIIAIDGPEDNRQTLLIPHRVLKVGSQLGLENMYHQQSPKEPLHQDLMENIEPIGSKKIQCYQCLYFAAQWSICLDKVCIQRNVELCSFCLHSHSHTGHKVIQANIQSLTEIFERFNTVFYQQANPPSAIEEKISILVSYLRMNLLTKLFQQSYKPKVMNTLHFLSALLFNSGHAIEWKIDQILKGNKDELYKLRLAYQLPNLLQPSYLNCILQVEIDSLKELVTNTYQVFKHSLDYFGLNVPEFDSIDIEHYFTRIEAKYRSVANIKTKKEFIVKPNNLYEISQIYYPYIKEIVIIKDKEEYQEEEIMKTIRKERSQFWISLYKMKDKIKNQILFNEKALNYFRFFNSQYFLQLSEIKQSMLPEFEESENSFTNDRKINKITYLYLLNKFSQFRGKEQYHWESPPLKIFQIILNNKIRNLVSLEIRYDHVRCCDYNSQYKLQAITLFQIIDRNLNLEKVAIEGVRLYHFGRFIVNFWRLRCKIQNIQDYEYKLNQEQEKMMRRLDPQKLIHFDLGILLKIRSKVVFHSFDYFLKVFPSICNLKIQITYSDEDDSQLLTVFKQNLQKITRLKIWILGQNFESNTLLLNAIKDLTNIVSVYISDFQFQAEPGKKIVALNQPSEVKQEKKQEVKGVEREPNSKMKYLSDYLLDYTRMFRQALTQMILNNQIQKLSVKRCSMVMSMPLQLPFTKELILISRDSDSFNCQSLINPDILELLYLENLHLQKEKLNTFFSNLQNIQYLQIINSDIENQHMKSIPLSSFQRIAILNLSQCEQIGNQFAEPVFPLLQELRALDISKTSISASLVLKIPSRDLLKIEISGLKEVEDKLLQEIDRQWPMLKILNIFGCKGVITKQGINQRSFRNLTELQISFGVLDETTKSKLLVRGVEILPFL